MKFPLSPGDIVVARIRFQLFNKDKRASGLRTFVEKNSTLLIVAVKDDDENDLTLAVCMLCSRTRQLGWTFVLRAFINDFSVLASSA